MTTIQAIQAVGKELTYQEDREALNTFYALWAVLGDAELHDGLCAEMQDLGLEDTYWTVIDKLEEEND